MSATFRNILQQATGDKISELRIQNDLLLKHFNQALAEAERTLATDPRASLEVLYEAIRDVVGIIDESLVANLCYILQNSNQDPSITPSPVDYKRQARDQACNRKNEILLSLCLFD